MKSKELFEAIGYIDERYLDMIDAPETEMYSMKDNHKRLLSRRTLSIMLAAVICISLLTVTATAAGWIPGLFNFLKSRFPQDKELFEAAAQANENAVPEVREIPHLDLSKFTLLEQYFDGNTILIGYNFDIILPEPTIGFEPDADLLAKIRNGANITSISWSGHESWLSEPDTENSRAYNLLTDAAEMDRMFKGTLSETDYQKVWNLMDAQGYVCVAVRDASLGDHIMINGVDTVEAFQKSNAYADRTEYTTEFGNCIRLEPLPEDICSQEQITITLNIFSSVTYWYMDLEGNGKFYYDISNRTTDQVSFVLDKVR